MIFKKTIILLLLCDLAAVAIALFDNCDFIVQLRPNEGTYVVSPGGYLQILNYFGYIGYYEPGSSCRYSVQAPANYALKLDCTIDIAVTNLYKTCFTEKFHVTIDGSNDIVHGGMIYCGKGLVNVRSPKNVITFGHTSMKFGGMYNCSVVAVYNYNYLAPADVNHLWRQHLIN